MLHFMPSLNLVELKQILGSVLSIGGCREKDSSADQEYCGLLPLQPQ